MAFVNGPPLRAHRHTRATSHAPRPPGRMHRKPAPACIANPSVRPTAAPTSSTPAISPLSIGRSAPPSPAAPSASPQPRKPRQREPKKATPRGRKRRSRMEEAMDIYLREIGELDLLDSDTEKRLSLEISDLMKLEQIAERLKKETGVQPSTDEWAAAAGIGVTAFREMLERGRSAKDLMIASNLRLVVSIAKKHQGRGVLLQDLVQEGSMGLIRGVEKFKPEMGCKLATYASWWIRQAVTRAIADKSRPIRLPVHINDAVTHIDKTSKRLSSELERPPTDEEIAMRMGITVERFRFLMRVNLKTVSLDNPVGRSDTAQNIQTRIAKIIWEGETPQQAVEMSLLQDDVQTVLNTLSRKEQEIIRLRFGFDNAQPKTLEEIGRIFGVSRERVRQLESGALAKLRHPIRNILLRDYIYE